MKNKKIEITLNEEFKAKTIEEAVEIIDVRTKRDELAERIDILEKVKALVLLPNIGMLTARQVADFYDVPLKTIQKTYSRFRKEIQSDGYILTTGKKLLVDKLSTRAYTVEHGLYRLELDDGSTVEIPNSTIGLFSARAVLRFGMLLRDSKIAQKIRTQLLNIRDNADDHTRTKAIDAELIELREKAAKYDALIGDMPVEVIESYETIIKYEKEKREVAEQKVTKFIEDDSLVPFDHIGVNHLDGMSSNALRSILQLLGVLGRRKTGGIYRPIGEYRKKKWFRIHETKSGYNGAIYRHLYVTRAGIIGITELVEESEDGSNQGAA
ncbi:phage antirepressor KilAC domain-containing protein [Bacillus thuringiensis]|uniref:Phage antirepressor KilAC domain-containing protein n=1 Tax=Bacillus thuringiensis serovar andalousiensis TaxID=257985 RepID=A0A6H0TAX7_BACTU|nr:phage antirepressor KilAC domain-containing protein [Bacillus thuringiensis]QIW18311.1 phage antirepressor KilAC domain-containing protein [Bacillus thuringiensis serovar andalousiensis]